MAGKAPSKNEVERLMKRCQIGGRSSQECHDVLAECYATLGAMDKEIRRLRDALVKIAELGSYYSHTSGHICMAREALGCRHMPYKDAYYDLHVSIRED